MTPVVYCTRHRAHHRSNYDLKSVTAHPKSWQVLAVVRVIALVFVAGTLLAGCSRIAAQATAPERAAPMPLPATIAVPSTESSPPSRILLASWYGPGFAGSKTASGEVYDPNGLTAASRELRLGSHVQVTNLVNGRTVNVRINDCGPYVRGRRLDLSMGAARELGLTRAGVVPVRVNHIAQPVRGRRCVAMRPKHRRRRRPPKRSPADVA